MGDYAIVVVATERIVKTREIKIAFGLGKLKKKATIGGAFINLGTTTLNIYAGKPIAGTPPVLLLGEKTIVPKGFSTFSVLNTSATTSGGLQVVPIKKVD